MLKVFTISTLSSVDNELKSILYAFYWDAPAKAHVWKTWFPMQQYSEDGFGKLLDHEDSVLARRLIH